MAKTKSQIPGLAKPRLSPERSNLPSHFRDGGTLAVLRLTGGSPARKSWLWLMLHVLVTLLWLPAKAGDA
jgi:hypothetical protein